MMVLLVTATLALMPADSMRHSGVPRRVVSIQDTAQDEDVRDRWFGEDKLKHLSMSYGITAFAYAGGRIMAGHDASAALAVAAGGSAGLLKEIWDVTHGRPFSLRDLVWDAAGVAAGYVMIKNSR